jgi:hypothetical protein
MAGLLTAGGSKTTTDRKSLTVISKFNIYENASGKIHLLDSISKVKKTMTIFPNPVSTSVTISYKIIEPGTAYMSVYDVYGVLKEVVFSSYKDIGEYTTTYTPANLQPGIYLLKLISKGDYQTLKFIYQ